MTIINKKTWHREHINKSLHKGKSFVNNLYATIGNSYNQMLIGKTCWQALALSCILYCQEILDNLQRIENSSFRTILITTGARLYSSGICERRSLFFLFDGWGHTIQIYVHELCYQVVHK